MKELFDREDMLQRIDRLWDHSLRIGRFVKKRTFVDCNTVSARNHVFGSDEINIVCVNPPDWKSGASEFPELS